MRQMATVVSQAIRDSGTHGYPRALPMTDALTPAQALDYLRTLSADIREAAVLDATGGLLAGPAELAEPARALLAAAPEADDLEVATGQGSVYAARSARRAAHARARGPRRATPARRRRSADFRGAAPFRRLNAAL